MLSHVAYTLKPSEGGSDLLVYDAREHWRPHVFRNTVSENVSLGAHYAYPAALE